MGVVASESNRGDTSKYFSLRNLLHVLNGNLAEFSFSRPYDYVSVRQKPNGGYSLGKEFLDWSQPLVDCLFNTDFEQIAGFAANVDVRVTAIDCTACEVALDIAKVDIDGENLRLKM